MSDEPSSSPCCGKNILLAEDILDNQELMKDMLEILQCNLDIAVDGEETVQKWKEKKYDLIIMDVQMPKLDGYEATMEIRKLEDGKSHTPILAITARALAGDREKCLEAGMDDYLSKPLTFDLFKNKLISLFEKCSK